MPKETATQWSIRTWKERHNQGYFPNSEQHQDWKVFDKVPDWLSGIIFPNDVALEVGAGYGEWMIPLAPKVLSVQGIDIHPSLITKAKSLFKQHKAYNTDMRLSDGLSIPFPDDLFSLVYSISVFQHLPKKMVKGYLKETNRVLKPGGTMAHHFRSSENVGPFPKPADDIEVNHTGDFSAGWSFKEALEAGLKAGFETVRIIDLEFHFVLFGIKE